MSSKKELLKKLTVKQLRRLATDNNVELVHPWVFGHPPVTKKDDIIQVLKNSQKISIRKINKILREKKASKKTSHTSSLKRRTLTKFEENKILKRQGFKCAKCKRDLRGIVPNFDHKIALALGGSNNLRNFQALCGICHDKKTSEDRYKIARMRSRLMKKRAKNP